MPKAFIPQLEKGPFEFINKKCSVSVETEKEKKKRKKMKNLRGEKGKKRNQSTRMGNANNGDIHNG
jgi:hypothetical protein